MKAVIKLDVPDWQIGQDVSVYFPDTMFKTGKCETDRTKKLGSSILVTRQAAKSEDHALEIASKHIVDCLIKNGVLIADVTPFPMHYTVAWMLKGIKNDG